MRFIFVRLTCLILLVVCGCQREPEITYQKPIGSREVVLGQFDVSSGHLVISDPCYDLDTVRRGNGVEQKALNGKWISVMTLRDFDKPRDTRVGRLLVYHESVKDWGALKWNEIPYGMGVDTGQMSASDRALFQDPKVVPSDQKFTYGSDHNEPAIPDALWYSYCCELTIAKQGAVFKGGTATNAGWGDGSYLGLASVSEDGSLVAFRVEFIDEKGEQP